MRAILIWLFSAAACFAQFPYSGADWSAPAVAGGASVDNTFRNLGEWHNKVSAGSNTHVVSVTGMVANQPVWVLQKWESATTITSINDGTANLTLITNAVIGTTESLALYWIPSGHAASAMTTTFAGTATFRDMVVWQDLAYTTPVLSKVSINTNITGTAISSGNITTVGKGLVIGGFASFGGTLSGLLIGTNSCLPEPFYDSLAGTRAWQLQDDGPKTVDAHATLSASGQHWIIVTASFSGSGADPSTATNYAQTYIDMAGQTVGTTLTTGILGAGTHGYGTWNPLSPTPPTGFEVGVTIANLGLPVIVNGTVYTINHASQSLAYRDSANNTYVPLALNNGTRAITVAAMLCLNATNQTTGGSPWDLIGANTANGLGIVQLINGGAPTYNLRQEYKIGNVATASTGFGVGIGTTNFICYRIDHQNGITKLMAIDATTRSAVGSETVNIDVNAQGIVQLYFGNAEVGLSASATNYFQHLQVDYMNPGAFPFYP